MRWGLLLIWIFSLGALQAFDSTAEVRAGYFYPTSDLLRKIYSQGGAEEEIEISGLFYEQWQAWGNVGYFGKNGRSLGLRERTEIRLIPLSLGIKYVLLPSACIHPYLGLGASYTFFHVRNHSDYVKRSVSRGNMGFVVKSGFNIDLACHYFLDLFADYYYQYINLHSNNERHSIDIGGFKVGAGIGYRF